MNESPCTVSDIFTRVAGEHLNMRTNLTLGIASPVLLETYGRLNTALCALLDQSRPDMFLDYEIEIIHEVMLDIQNLQPEFRDLGFTEDGDYPSYE